MLVIYIHFYEATQGATSTTDAAAHGNCPVRRPSCQHILKKGNEVIQKSILIRCKPAISFWYVFF